MHVQILLRTVQPTDTPSLPIQVWEVFGASDSYITKENLINSLEFDAALGLADITREELLTKEELSLVAVPTPVLINDISFSFQITILYRA